VTHYAAAFEELRDAQHRPESFARAFVDVFPISGAAVSTLGDVLGTETISASDQIAARLDELQFDYIEGPCWDALATRRPVLEPGLAIGGGGQWPVFTPAARDTGVRSIFAFPLLAGTVPLGAIDLYALSHVTLSDDQCRQAIAMGEIIGQHVLRRAIREGDHPTEEPSPRFSRRVIHQATGVVLAQLQISADDAALVIQGHAFTLGRPVKSIAQDIVDGTLSFHRGESGIEASETSR
jgi:hypothetical protein